MLRRKCREVCNLTVPIKKEDDNNKKIHTN